MFRPTLANHPGVSAHWIVVDLHGVVPDRRAEDSGSIILVVLMVDRMDVWVVADDNFDGVTPNAALQITLEFEDFQRVTIHVRRMMPFWVLVTATVYFIVMDGVVALFEPIIHVSACCQQRSGADCRKQSYKHGNHHFWLQFLCNPAKRVPKPLF